MPSRLWFRYSYELTESMSRYVNVVKGSSSNNYIPFFGYHPERRNTQTSAAVHLTRASLFTVTMFGNVTRLYF